MLYMIFLKFIQCPIYRNKTEMLKNFSSDKTNITRMPLFLHSRAPTHHSFISYPRFSYELKHKVRLFKSDVWFSILNIVSLLLKFSFLFNKKRELFGFKTSKFPSKLE